MIVLTFQQLTDALMFEESAKKKEPEFRLIPVPRKISSSCGLAARTAMSVEDVQKILDAEGIESDGIYKEDNNEYIKL